MKGRQSLSQPHLIGSEDQRRLLDYLREHANSRDYAAVLLCLRTGLSTSEAVSLDVRHVLRDSAAVSVLEIDARIAKGGIAHRLPLDAETSEALQDTSNGKRH